MAADSIVEFFDRRAADYEREYEADTPAGYALRVRRRKVLDLFDRPGGQVLDVGCGPGVMTTALLQRGCEFWGVDPSPGTLAIARARFQGIERAPFVQGGAERLEFDDAVFDAVLCMGVIDSLSNRPQAIREMIRVLKPGGTLICTVANLLSPYAAWKNFGYYPAVGVWHRLRARFQDGANRAAIRDCPPRTLHTRRSASRLVASTGATVVASVPYSFNVFISPLDEMMPHVAVRVTKAMEEGEWRWPGWLATGWILKARKA
jgi:SAM-dependent methyltransferase